MVNVALVAGCLKFEAACFWPAFGILGASVSGRGNYLRYLRTSKLILQSLAKYSDVVSFLFFF